MGDLGQGLPASRLRSTASSARRLRKRCISVYKTRAIIGLEQKCIRKGIFLRASTAACRCFLNCQCCVLQSCYNAFVNMNTCKNTKTSIVNVQFSGRMTTTNDMLHCDFQYRGLLHSLRHLRLPQPSRATVRKCNRQVGHTIHLRFVSGGFCYDVNPPTSLSVARVGT